ncbi:hypothetical protein ACFO0S_11220 [Chryseomicrobium palamuruense]|uniref:Uncharacterized protein n=1 Tax=Chryseomicrobium palamuruense TaxID=682973 RepID=A0ABV8UYL1_9BACL
MKALLLHDLQAIRTSHRLRASSRIVKWRLLPTICSTTSCKSYEWKLGVGSRIEEWASTQQSHLIKMNE